MYQNMIIFQKVYEMNLWLFPLISKFPKNQRFVLGQQMETLALRVMMGIMRANATREKLSHLQTLSVDLDMLRVLMRLAHDLKMITTRQYSFGSEYLSEIGRLLGGWLKSSTK